MDSVMTVVVLVHVVVTVVGNGDPVPTGSTHSFHTKAVNSFQTSFDGCPCRQWLFLSLHQVCRLEGPYLFHFVVAGCGRASQQLPHIDRDLIRYGSVTAALELPVSASHIYEWLGVVTMTVVDVVVVVAAAAAAATTLALVFGIAEFGIGATALGCTYARCRGAQQGIDKGIRDGIQGQSTHDGFSSWTGTVRAIRSAISIHGRIGRS
mmetsp:Transcript_17740/g.32827  ORF Transcript_17740/g.32827 Transcript_17740/m.32827 type:complete len:208 (+) Transcript_17740:1065-1688(+)